MIIWNEPKPHQFPQPTLFIIRFNARWFWHYNDEKFGIKKPNAILEEVVYAVNQWLQIAREIDIPQEKIQYINAHLRT